MNNLFKGRAGQRLNQSSCPSLSDNKVSKTTQGNEFFGAPESICPAVSCSCHYSVTTMSAHPSLSSVLEAHFPCFFAGKISSVGNLGVMDTGSDAHYSVC